MMKTIVRSVFVLVALALPMVVIAATAAPATKAVTPAPAVSRVTTPAVTVPVVKQVIPLASTTSVINSKMMDYFIQTSGEIENIHFSPDATLVKWRDKYPPTMFAYIMGSSQNAADCVLLIPNGSATTNSDLYTRNTQISSACESMMYENLGNYAGAMAKHVSVL